MSTGARLALAECRLGLAHAGADPARPSLRVNPRPRYRAMEQHFEATGRAPGRAGQPTVAGLADLVESGRCPGDLLAERAGGAAEYTAGTFRQACWRLSIAQAMGRPGSALDHAAIESCHFTLEFELRSLQRFATRAQARAAVAAWIEESNTRRRHSACQKLPPAAYEHLLAERGKEAV